MYPVQRSESDITGAAALLEVEASDKLLLVDSRTARSPEVEHPNVNFEAQRSVSVHQKP